MVDKNALEGYQMRRGHDRLYCYNIVYALRNVRVFGCKALEKGWANVLRF